MRECPICGVEFTPEDELNPGELCSWSCVEQSTVNDLADEAFDDE